MPARVPDEELVRTCEEQFSFLADYIPALVWIANADGWIYWYNQSWYAYTGTTPEQMAGWGWQSVHDPAILPMVLERWKTSIATGEPFEMVFPLRRADGVLRTFLTRANALCDAQGKVLRWVGTNADIALQREAEALLNEKDKLLRAAFYQTYSFMVILAGDGTVLEINEAALQATNCKRKDMVGRKFWDGPWWRDLPEEIAAVEAAVSRALAGETVREECLYRIGDGTVRCADRTFSPAREGDGPITLVVASGIDTTEQKQLRDKLEERVRERTSELEEKHELLQAVSGRLLRSQDEERKRIARELHDSAGQLVSALSMNMGMVQREADNLSSGAAKALQENSKLLRQLTEEIRTMSHLLHPPLLEELGLLTSLRSYTQGFAERSNIRVTLDFPENIDGLPRSMELPLFRIVQECLTNVYRHAKSPTAHVRITHTPERVVLEVRDEGKGMPQELAGGGAGTVRLKGEGVGLSGMRERVREYGGRIDVLSSAAGTTITTTLPIQKGASS